MFLFVFWFFYIFRVIIIAIFVWNSYSVEIHNNKNCNTLSDTTSDVHTCNKVATRALFSRIFKQTSLILKLCIRACSIKLEDRKIQILVAQKAVYYF